MKQLAIIIPYYKPDFFIELLDSLAAQSSKDFHCYIGDDASATPVHQLTEAYQDKFPCTIHRFEENVGAISLVQQWERCISLSQQEPYISIIGDDDILAPNYVQSILEAIPNAIQQNIEVLKTSVQLIDEHSAIIRIQDTAAGVQLASQQFIAKYVTHQHSSLTEYVFSRKAFNTIGFRDYPMAWCSDDMAWLDMSNNDKLLGISETYVGFRLSPASISGGTGNQEKKIAAKKQFFEDIVQEHLTKFSNEQQVIILKKYEVFLVLNKSLKSKHYSFFNQHYKRLKVINERLKLPLRFMKNLILKP